MWKRAAGIYIKKQYRIAIARMKEERKGGPEAIKALVSLHLHKKDTEVMPIQYMNNFNVNMEGVIEAIREGRRGS